MTGSDRRDERRQQLVEAARRVVQRFGYKKTTLEDIAEEGGVSRATLYYYFPNREEVFRALILHEIETLTAAVTRAVDLDDPPDVRLRSLVRARQKHLKQIKALYAVRSDIGRDLLPMAEEYIQRATETELAMITSWLREGVESGRFRPDVDAEVLALAICAGLRGLEEAYIFENRTAMVSSTEALFDCLMYGLLSEEQRGER